MISQSARKHIGNRGPQISISSDFRRLTWLGVVIDHIDGLGGIPGDIQGWSQQFIQSTLTYNTTQVSTENPDQYDFLDKMVRCITLNRHDRYLSVVAPLGRFRDEFLSLTVTADQLNANLPGSLRLVL